MENEMYDEKGLLKPEFEMTDYEKRNSIYNNDVKKIDNRTDFEKGICFKSVDGKEWSTYEEAMAYNKEWYDMMFPKIDKQDSHGLKR